LIVRKPLSIIQFPGGTATVPTKAKTQTTEQTIEIKSISTVESTFWLVGQSPLILNRMSQKAAHELLYPKGRTNAADRASRLKHDPIQEFQSAPYRLTNPDAPTLLAVMASSVKGSMMTAALDLPGSSKTQIGRLVVVQGEYLPIFGIPSLMMSIVRSADAARTPDVRTRCVVKEWATQVTISYVTPLLSGAAVTNLLSAGGLLAGIGDWRPEKGKGAFGQFRVTTNDNDPELLEILSHGRAEQAHAMEHAEPYDAEAHELLEWFKAEVKTRGQGKMLAMPDLATIVSELNGKAEPVKA
jgi:hypothetical protein